MKVNLLQPERPPRPPEIHAFLAVDLDDELTDQVAALAERLRGDPRLSGATWGPPEAYQATLAFFLRTHEAQRQRLRAFVDELAASLTATGPSALVRVTRLHGLPTPDSANFLLLDLEDAGPEPYLSELVARAEVEHVAHGNAPTTRPFPTHLKLARMTPAVDVSELAGAARSLRPGRLVSLSLYVTSAVQDGEVHNRYDWVATAPLRAP